MERTQASLSHMQACVAGQWVGQNAAYGVRYTFTARQAIAKQSAERGIDEETLEIRAIEVTSSSIGDAPMLPDFLDQIPSDEEIGTVTADGAYDTRKCHDAIAARNAHPVIPPRKNAKLWPPPLSCMQACTAGQWTRPEQGPETKRFGPQRIWDAHCGGN